MFVKKCKVKARKPFDGDENGIKIIATKNEKDAFLLGAEKVHQTGDARYSRFMDHVLIDWKKHVPSTQEEEEAFDGEQAYSLELNQENLTDVVSFWFWLSSYFEDKEIG